ncbi:MAG: Omp28-related outer membrane protein [Chitinophagales bacterium]|nr:Omp28-related outer membrane protein [Chitinophagales bacterium]
MQKLYTLLVFSLFLTYGIQAQVSFSDNFDSYPEGSYLGLNNSAWTTWSGKPGTDEDAKIVSDKSKSPSNSILIQAQNNSGGPMDLVLPFGEKFTKGTFVLKMSLFIPSKKTAYFNLQANEKIGDAWALDANFGTNGIMDLTNGGTNLLATRFPIDEWFDLEFNINLSANLWRVLINGECRGSFANTLNSVAFLDIYPTNGNCTFYVDDVFFSHDPSASTLDLDASITGFTWASTKLSGSSDSPICYIQNNGTTVIKSAEVVFSATGLDDEVYQLNDLNLKRNEKSLIYLPEVVLQNGANVMTVVITKVNDQDGDDENCNNIFTYVLDAIVPAAHKRVLVEEATGTWCPWCPRGAVFMDRYNDIYNDLFIPIAMHGGSSTEPMRLAEYEQFLGFSAYPNCKVDRGSDIDPSVTEAPFLENIVKAPVAKLESGARLDTETNTLDVSVEVEFLQKGVGNYYVSLVLTEDGVKGTTSAYNQANAYAGGGSGVMGGYELLPNPVPASKMVYNHVARAVSGLSRTTANSLTGSLEEGTKHVVYFSIKLDNKWNQKTMHIIPVLLRNAVVMNANTSTIDEAINFGYITGTKEVELDAALNIYPNPADNYANVEFVLPQTSDVTIELYNMDGSISQSKVFEQQSGHVLLKMPVESLTSGIYLMKINTNVGSKYGKIVISK